MYTINLCVDEGEINSALAIRQVSRKEKMCWFFLGGLSAPREQILVGSFQAPA